MPTTLNAETIEQITLPSGKDEGLGNLNVIKQLILPHREEFKDKADKSRDELPKKMVPGTCLDLATGGGRNSCDGRSCVRYLL